MRFRRQPNSDQLFWRENSAMALRVSVVVARVAAATNDE
jgi:hypothetical protein